jgi:hypothetical protein
VSQVVALDAEHPKAAAGEMEQGGAAHPAQADHDGIVGRQNLALRIQKLCRTRYSESTGMRVSNGS